MASQPPDKRGSASSQSRPASPESPLAPTAWPAASASGDSFPDALPASGPRERIRHTPYAGEGQPVRQFARGERIDRYIVLHAAGEGGMGIVYAAYDPELDRKVAVKLLRVEGHETDPAEGRARLLREAQAMARISHPNVCSVFDVGTVDDQVFMAMEYIEGPSLRQWLKAKPRSWREIVRLFMEAGEGLAAAHAAGLVHRDFKPSNVLIGKDGRAHVTDFGLARQIAAAEVEEGEDSFKLEEVARHAGATALASFVTQMGVVTGTPQYMPPEQYLGNTPDARSDEFSFCAALYWALYRKRPFKPEKVAGAAQEISQSRMTPERTLSSGRRSPTAGGIILEPPSNVKVPAWLRRAVLRGLSLHPDERFPSMKELLGELGQEPRRLARQWMAVGVGVMAGLAALTTVQLRRQGQVCAGADQPMAQVWSPQARQKLEAALAATGPLGADVAKGVGDALDAYAREWRQQAIDACTATQVRRTQTEALLSLRTVCLERRRKDFQSLAQLLSGGKPSVVAGAADAVGGLPALADCQDIESLSNEVSRPSDPAKRARIDELEALLADVDALNLVGLHEDAVKNARQLEPRIMETGYLPLQAELHLGLAVYQYRQGDYAAGFANAEKALAEAEAARADRKRYEALNRLVLISGRQQSWQQVQQWGRLGEAVIQRLGGDAGLASLLKGALGTAALELGRYPDAKRYLEEQRALQANAPSVPQLYRVRTAYNLGLVHMSLGNFARAAELLGEALGQFKALLGNRHPEVASCHFYLSAVYGELGKVQESLEHSEEALAIRKAVFGDQSPQVAEVLDGVGTSQMKAKRFDEAKQTFEAAVALKTKLLGADSPELTFSYDGIGQTMVAAGRYAEAIPPLEKALTYTKGVPPDELGESGFSLARALWETGGSRERATAEALKARDRFAQAEKQGRVKDVEEWLQSRGKSAVVPAHHAPRRKGR